MIRVSFDWSAIFHQLLREREREEKKIEQKEKEIINVVLLSHVILLKLETLHTHIHARANTHTTRLVSRRSVVS